MIFRRNDGFNTFSLGEFLSRPFRAMGGLFAGWFGGDDAIGRERSLLGGLLSIILLPGRFLLAFAGFMIQSWATTRIAGAFVWGLPAVLTVVMFLSGIWAANFLRESRSVIASQAYYFNFIEQSPDMPENSLMFARKLVELKPQEQSMRFQLGEALERCDDMHGALDVMRSLAPEDRPGFPMAHLWMANHLDRERLIGSKPVDEDRIFRHLQFAVEQAPDNVQAHYELAAFYETRAMQYPAGSPERTAELEKAIGHIETILNAKWDRITNYHISAVGRLVQLMIALDRPGEASRRLQAELQRIQPIARDYPEYFGIWQTLVTCAVYLKDYDQAQEIIQEGFQLAQSPEVRERIARLSSSVMLERAGNYTDMSDREQYRMRLMLLCEAVTIHPRNRENYAQLIQFIAQETNPDFNEIWLRDSIIGPNPGIVHVLLGVLEISRGNVLEGQKHWRIAEQQFPQVQFVVNNMIDVAAADFPLDFSNMLDMVSLAIELFPDQPLLYQTRGVYLKKNQQYKDAIVDLEHAASQVPKLLSVRKHLIDCYDQLGDPGRADEHRTAMEGILAELDTATRRQYEESLRRMN